MSYGVDRRPAVFQLFENSDSIESTIFTPWNHILVFTYWFPRDQGRQYRCDFLRRTCICCTTILQLTDPCGG